jgi:hypothetical protein
VELVELEAPARFCHRALERSYSRGGSTVDFTGTCSCGCGRVVLLRLAEGGRGFWVARGNVKGVLRVRAEEGYMINTPYANRNGKCYSFF